MVAFRASHGITIRFYGRKITFLSFFVKSSLGNSKLKWKLSIFYGPCTEFFKPKKSKKYRYCFIKPLKSFNNVNRVQQYHLNWWRTLQSVFMTSNVKLIHFLKQNTGFVVLSTEISLKKVFFEIPRETFLSILSQIYRLYGKNIQT